MTGRQILRVAAQGALVVVAALVTAVPAASASAQVGEPAGGFPNAVEVTDGSATLRGWLEPPEKPKPERPEPPESSEREGALDEPPETWSFEYAPGPKCHGLGSNRTPRQPPPTGTQLVEAQVNYLQAATEYTACLEWTAGYRVIHGAEFSFDTLPAGNPSAAGPPPSVVEPSTVPSPSHVTPPHVSRLAAALKRCAKKPRQRRRRCVRYVRRRYGVGRKVHAS